MIRDGNVYKAVIQFPRQEKVVFKFIVDGNWTTSSAYGVETDSSGIENNYIEASALVEVSQFEEVPRLLQVSTGLSFAAVLPPVGTTDVSEGVESLDEPSIGSRGIESVNLSKEEPKQQVQIEKEADTVEDDTPTALLVDLAILEDKHDKPRRDGLINRFRGLFRY